MNEEINDSIEQYEKDSMNFMVDDNIESPDELEDQFNRFKSMSYDRQRVLNGNTSF